MLSHEGRLLRALETAQIMKGSYQVLKTFLRTEKGAVEAVRNKYLFSVVKDANKIQIKKAVEDIYKVEVTSVNTQVMPGKLKRVRREQGRTPDWKKAVVTLKEGQKIDLV